VHAWVPVVRTGDKVLAALNDFAVRVTRCARFLTAGRAVRTAIHDGGGSRGEALRPRRNALGQFQVPLCHRVRTIFFFGRRSLNGPDWAIVYLLLSKMLRQKYKKVGSLDNVIILNVRLKTFVSTPLSIK
jgi:hypothetical protein